MTCFPCAVLLPAGGGLNPCCPSPDVVPRSSVVSPQPPSSHQPSTEARNKASQVNTRMNKYLRFGGVNFLEWSGIAFQPRLPTREPYVRPCVLSCLFWCFKSYKLSKLQLRRWFNNWLILSSSNSKELATRLQVLASETWTFTHM